MFKKYFKKIYKARLKKLKAKYIANKKIASEKYISILNHDIKTALLAQIQAIKLYLNNSAPKEILEDVLNSNYFLYEIIKNTIFLTEYENSKTPVKLESVNLAKITGDIKKSVENFARRKNQNIILKTSSSHINCRANKLYVNRIIYNILTSAVSCGFEGSDIEVSIKDNKDCVYFEAKNKSCYMDKEKIKSTLREKTHNDFNQLGINLNLSIANKLICAHNWDIIANSSKNHENTIGFIARK